MKCEECGKEPLNEYAVYEGAVLCIPCLKQEIQEDKENEGESPFYFKK